jgi:hypothetical protein
VETMGIEPTTSGLQRTMELTSIGHRRPNRKEIGYSAVSGASHCIWSELAEFHLLAPCLAPLYSIRRRNSHTLDLSANRVTTSEKSIWSEES